VVVVEPEREADGRRRSPRHDVIARRALPRGDRSSPSGLSIVAVSTPPESRRVASRRCARRGEASTGRGAKLGRDQRADR
jgi:hypothetical protein